MASCFDFKASRRNKVVTTALDFPSMGISGKLAKQVALALREVVPCPDEYRFHWNRFDAIDDETCLVALSYFIAVPTGSKAAAIVQHAHAKGALVLFDVYQSAGVVPLEAET